MGSPALKAKKESGDEESSASVSEDEEYAMAVRDFKKFFKRRESALDAEIRITLSENVQNQQDKKTKGLLYEDLGVIGEEDEEKNKDETYLMAQASNEVLSESSYYSDDISSMDDYTSDNEYHNLYPDEGIKDSGCTTHMIGNQKLFCLYKAYNRDNLGFNLLSVSQSLVSKELVISLPKLKFDQHLCDAYKIRKQAHTSHKAKNMVSMTRCLELSHIDLFGLYAYEVMEEIITP
ncbi:hypothetical protein Tco_0962715 [Tanacetum coccineum]